jgi:hypothetical protein
MTVEIVCDESGSEGEKLVGGVTAVFAHAAVRLDVPAAEACVLELRDRIRSPALEYKANHLLRTKNRAALTWLLGRSGPLLERAHVQLVDKRAFLAERVVSACGRRPTGPLESCNEALRARGPRGALDPLFPAIVRAVAHWGGDVAIVHDHQPSLTEARIRTLREAAPGLRSLTLVDSRGDARVQVADFLAGVARRTAEDELHGDRDEEIVALLRPYVFGVRLGQDSARPL